MSNAEDKESKTEEPTENRLRTAIEKGNIPSSREVATFGPLLASLIVVFILAEGATLPLALYLSRFIENPGAWTLSTGRETIALFHATWVQAGWVIIPPVLILAAAGVASAFVQNQPRLVMNRIQPQLSRVSITSGWTRLFGARGLVEFGKAIFKLIFIAAVAVHYLNASKIELINAMAMDPAGLPQLIYRGCAALFSVFIVLSLALVVADWLWVRFSWKRDLRMSRQELKDEMKQLQGDPLIKARLRSLARDRARRRMISSVSRATIVIANPTHFAVALRYVRSEGGAPIVLAKGKDLIALKIREIAEEKGIPVVEDKPLARSLYDSVEVDKMIPPEFYRAVAKIILYLTSRGKLRQTT